ncbi:expressed unknown protein [Seminavis robusta]|uniref:Fe2OG dioxygenase domain-containing protein n=1 Tax=Seminavis robusta TaxID=568900 RepID=A0A9N8HNR1_9STRA|nr:expressed unknown protein [Seminavis robusta]|eukprot:Sro1017_g231800.1 n/a (303) ;mRNA; f:37347-38255
MTEISSDNNPSTETTTTTTTNSTCNPSSTIQAEEVLIKNGKPLAKLDPNHALRSFSLGERIKGGRSILKLTNLIQPDEIDTLVKSSLAAAEERKGGSTEPILEQDDPNRVLIRLLPTATAQRENAPQDALPEPVSQLMEEILERALTFLDQQVCPSVRTTLFGDDCSSMAALLRDNQLEYSNREPAINVYEAPHGHFNMHKDHHALSIVMPLSVPAKDFKGGGTAFWSQSHPIQGMDSPSIVLKPPPGTAMVWGGRVSHKGVRITQGTRVVFVASFSGPNTPDDVRARLSAGMGLRTVLSGR